jgi:transposase
MTATAKTKKIEKVDVEELERILEQAKASLSEEEHRKLKAAVETLAYLTGEIQDKRTTIRQLRKLLFGSTSEKTSKVLPEESDEGATDSDGKEDSAEAAGDGNSANQNGTAKKKRKGHGRNGAEKYVGAETIEIPHESLKGGDDCPAEGCKGKVYRLADPGVLVRIVGQAPLYAKVYKLEKLRCGLCLTIYTATPPDGVKEEKYDVTAVAMMAILRYGSGLPLKRLERLQESLGIPLPTSTQWDVAKEAVSVFAPAYAELIRQAAQGYVVHNDDTSMKILELMKEDQERRERGETPERTGIFTSGIVSVRDGIKIALFFTGREHAGENLSKVLTQRAAELAPVIQMSDALSRNVSKEFATILCNCLCHARRGYVDVVEDFPQECEFVLKTLRVVFKNDAIAQKEGLSAQERLEFHRKESKRPMAELRLWMWKQFRDRLVEPNSGLGQAIAYMRKHWRKLTRFLFVAGAPIDNNLVERSLKRAILHRRNSLFYKTENGARVGDLYMSLIATCQLAGANPFDYLSELQRHAAEVAKDPAKWMPWNYRQALESAPG